MPVEEYLLEETIFATAHQDAAQAIKVYAAEYDKIQLYATGLTRALLGAIAGFNDHHAVVDYCDFNDPTPKEQFLEIWEYNNESQVYEHTMTFVARYNKWALPTSPTVIEMVGIVTTKGE